MIRDCHVTQLNSRPELGMRSNLTASFMNFIYEKITEIFLFLECAIFYIGIEILQSLLSVFDLVKIMLDSLCKVFSLK